MKPITVTSYIRQGDSIRRMDSLTDVELERFLARARETFSAVVGDHMRTHQEEKTAHTPGRKDCVHQGAPRLCDRITGRKDVKKWEGLKAIKCSVLVGSATQQALRFGML